MTSANIPVESGPRTRTVRTAAGSATRRTQSPAAKGTSCSTTTVTISAGTDTVTPAPVSSRSSSKPAVGAKVTLPATASAS